jgi:hypothetical protein
MRLFTALMKALNRGQLVKFYRVDSGNLFILRLEETGKVTEVYLSEKDLTQARIDPDDLVASHVDSMSNMLKEG